MGDGDDLNVVQALAKNDRKWIAVEDQSLCSVKVWSEKTWVSADSIKGWDQFFVKPICSLKALAEIPRVSRFNHTGSHYNLPMQPSFDEVEKLARALPEDQRVRLANSLYESVSDEEQASEAEIEAAWGDEIKRRLDEIDSGAVELIPGEEVMGRMLKSLSPEARARLRK